MKDLLYCDGCPHLEPREHEQTSSKEAHKCNAYDKVLKHNGHHPRIPTPNYCMVDGWRREKSYYPKESREEDKALFEIARKRTGIN